MRIFIAIELPEPSRDALTRLQQRIPFGRIAAPETLHLTLAFAGEIGPEALDALHEELSRIRAPAFDLALRGLGTFGKATPALLYAEVPLVRPLADLRRKVLQAMRRAGLDLPRERFRPHVTLARFSKHLPPADHAALARFLARNAAFEAPGFTARAFTLFQSTLRPSGPVHEALTSYPLQEGPQAT